MTILLACVFVLMHVAAILVLPEHTMRVSYGFLIAAPVCASIAAARRGIEGRSLQSLDGNWLLSALSMLLWTGGMAASLRQDLFLDNSNTAPGDSTLLFILYAVPLVLAMSVGRPERESPVLRIIDSVLAIMLGYLFYVHTFSFLTLQGANSRTQALLVVSMYDAENLFLALAALIHLRAADNRHEYHFYRTLAVFTVAYAVISSGYNRFVVLGDHPSFGSWWDILVDLPFLTFAVLAWHGADPAQPSRMPSVNLVRIVRSGSPLLMAAALLVVALFVLRERFYLGVTGIVVAVAGYGIRNVFTQVRQIQAEEGLLSQRSDFEKLSLTDGLTGIPNRRALDTLLEREWQRAAHTRRRLTLLMIDIDYFKRINDRHGHPAGDACLRQVASAMQKELGRATDFLGRFGGEEFALVLVETSLAEGMVVAQRLRAAVGQLDMPNEDSPTGRLTISIGVASMLVEETTAAGLIETADKALYQAKLDGRDRIATWT